MLCDSGTLLIRVNKRELARSLSLLMRSARRVIHQAKQRYISFGSTRRQKKDFLLEEATCKILIKRFYRTWLCLLKIGKYGLKRIFFVFFPRVSIEIIQSAGSWFEEELICQQGRTGILISTAMKSQYNSEAAVSFGTRSFIFYIFCHCLSLFSSHYGNNKV